MPSDKRQGFEATVIEDPKTDSARPGRGVLHTAPAGAGKFAGYQAIHVSGKLRCPRRGLPLIQEKKAKEDQGLTEAGEISRVRDRS